MSSFSPDFATPTTDAISCADDNVKVALSCPICGERFQQRPSEFAPVLCVDCGHTICGVCDDAVRMLSDPVCGVIGCNVKLVTPSVPNLAIEQLCDVNELYCVMPTLPGNSSVRQTCSRHPGSELDRLCCTHSVIICGDCEMSTHHSTSGCEVETLTNNPRALTLLTPRLRSYQESFTSASVQAYSSVEFVRGAIVDMTVRMTASIDTFTARIERAKAALDSYRTKIIHDVNKLYRDRVKALEAQADGLTVRGDQLAAMSAACDASLKQTEPNPIQIGQTMDTLRQLQRLSEFERYYLTVPAVAAIESTVDECVAAFLATGTWNDNDITRIRKCGMDMKNCVVNGPGLEAFITGDTSTNGLQSVDHNIIRIQCRDGDGFIVSDVTSDDVMVTIRGDMMVGGSGGGDGKNNIGEVLSKGLRNDGVVEVVYGIDPEYDGDEVTVDVSVRGQRWPLGPVQVPSVHSRLFPGSRVFQPSDMKAVQRFEALLLQELFSTGAKVRDCVWRASEHGNLASDFHQRCDGIGGTLTLVRSTNGYTFGGYVSSSWNSTDVRLTCTKSFMFTITNPHDEPPRLFKPRLSCGCGITDGSHTMTCHRTMCVTMGCGYNLMLKSGLPSSCCSGLHPTVGLYHDSLGYGQATFTGDYYFTPQEVEVWRVV